MRQPGQMVPVRHQQVGVSGYEFVQEHDSSVSDLRVPNLTKPDNRSHGLWRR